ncbi:MAG: DMT family transporter [Solirubrobacteraceae bacterium]
MDRGLAVVLTAIGGGLVALQAPINSMLGKQVGTFQAAFVSFAIGTLALAMIAALAKGGMGQIAEARHLSWYYLTGGLLGAAYVTTVLVTVRTLGAGGAVAATIAGQLTMSVVIDHYGWLGVQRDPVDALKLIGVALLSVGTYLVVRD